MSDLMFYGVLRMPYGMAMSDEMSRLQFYNRAQEAADRVQAAEREVAELRAALAGQQGAVPAERLAVIAEAAQVFESGASHNRAEGRTVFAHAQQDRADRLRAILAAPQSSGARDLAGAAACEICDGTKTAFGKSFACNNQEKRP